MKIVVMVSESPEGDDFPAGIFDTLALAESVIKTIGKTSLFDPTLFGCDFIREIDEHHNYFFTLIEVQENAINIE